MIHVMRATLSVVATLVFLSPVSITNAAEERVSLMEEVVVVARKREESAQDVPIPVTAVGGQQLENRNIRDITEIEKLSPNTDISSSSVNNSATQVFIRGIGQVNWASTRSHMTPTSRSSRHVRQSPTKDV